MSDHSSRVDSDPSTVVASPAASLELQSSPKADNNDQEKDKSSGNELPSSSNNKRKFEEDSESSVQPTEDYQDSSDITSEGEPFFFMQKVYLIIMKKNIYNEFIFNTFSNRNFRFRFKQKKYNINAYFNRNNAISYYILNIDKFT